MAKTFNGWPVIRHPGRGTFKAPNGKTVYTANDDVATIFKYVAEQWHERIETLPKAQYNTYPNEREGYIVIHGSRPYGTLVGQGNNSNHVSGTAMDILGGRHPYELTNPPEKRFDGYDDGFSNRQRYQLIQIRNEIGKNDNGLWILRLGIHFAPGWRDGMHVEIAPGISSSDVHQAALRLSKKSESEEEFDMSDAQYQELKQGQEELLDFLKHHIGLDLSAAEKKDLGTTRDLALKQMLTLDAKRTKILMDRQWDVIKATDAVVKVMEANGTKVTKAMKTELKQALASSRPGEESS